MKRMVCNVLLPGVLIGLIMPKNLGIGGSIGVLALNCMIGGMIGGFVLCIKIITILMELMLIILETFGQKVLK